MRQTTLLFSLGALALAGCVDWPDVDDAAGDVSSAEWPVLQPLGALQTTTITPEDAGFDAIVERAARLRARASVLRAPVTDQASFDRLRDRLSR